MSTATAHILDTADSGRSTAAILAVMIFLTMVATAGGIATARAGRALGTALARQATVQIVAADADARARLAERMLTALQATPGVIAATPVPREEVTRLLGPWLGAAADDGDLPVPALIDVTLAARVDAAGRLRAAAAQVTPLAQVDMHAAALTGTGTLLSTMTALAAATVAMTIAASAAVVLLAVRTGLAAHRTTIEVMHGLGATDAQIARLFRRRIARDAGAGAAVGALAAWTTVALLGRLAERAGAQVLDGATLGQQGWAAVLLLPFGLVALAALVADRAVVRALGRMAW